MRIVAILMLVGIACCADDAFGTWKMNAVRSTFTGVTEQPKSLIVRFEPHPKGEVFTLDRIEADGRATSSSTILYFDGEPRDFQDFECKGTQSSRRVDGQTVEILRKCARREWTWVIRRSAVQPQNLTIEITEHRPDGRGFERHLVLERSGEPRNTGRGNDRRER